jgi:molybdopterin-guanine dinucleotide biosynthesis protein A
MSKRSDVLGAILAGGKSTRMGTEKALLPLIGRPMIQHAAETLSSLFSKVVVVGGAKDKYGFLKLEVLPDLYEGCGPLGGIQAALNRAKPLPVFVLSCDTPFIPVELIEYLLGFKSAAPTRIPTFDGVLQPLCGLYDSTSLEVIEDDLRERKYSVLKSISKLDHAVVPITPDLPFFTSQIFWNVNRPEDYRSISDPMTGTPHG